MSLLNKDSLERQEMWTVVRRHPAANQTMDLLLRHLHHIESLLVLILY